MLQARRVRKAVKVRSQQQAFKELKAHKARLAQRERLGLPERRVRKVLKELLVI